MELTMAGTRTFVKVHSLELAGKQVPNLVLLVGFE